MDNPLPQSNLKKNSTLGEGLTTTSPIVSKKSTQYNVTEEGANTTSPVSTFSSNVDVQTMDTVRSDDNNKIISLKSKISVKPNKSTREAYTRYVNSYQQIHHGPTKRRRMWIPDFYLIFRLIRIRHMNTIQVTVWIDP